MNACKQARQRRLMRAEGLRQAIGWAEEDLRHAHLLAKDHYHRWQMAEQQARRIDHRIEKFRQELAKLVGEAT
ncbi:MAG: hypothetical protein HY675_17475 [Chloroflexi bacterium]|nr:hypothetical protein [Chloroflexota bacterium]